MVHLGTFSPAASSIGLVYWLGIIVLPFAKETQGEALKKSKVVSLMPPGNSRPPDS